MVYKRILKFLEKGGSLGRTCILLYVAELALVWFIYFCFGWATQYDMPLWLASLLVLIVDRLVNAAADLRKTQQARS